LIFSALFDMYFRNSSAKKGITYADIQTNWFISLRRDTLGLCFGSRSLGGRARGIIEFSVFPDRGDNEWIRWGRKDHYLCTKIWLSFSHGWRSP
jgi:hypothetical protein